uniref:Uncharacterized protein n=1 Tax=Arundo donax TaxID=35708 RepID=A0A0A9HS10_ARUDO
MLCRPLLLRLRGQQLSGYRHKRVLLKGIGVEGCLLARGKRAIELPDLATILEKALLLLMLIVIKEDT